MEDREETLVVTMYKIYILEQPPIIGEIGNAAIQLVQSFVKINTIHRDLTLNLERLLARRPLCCATILMRHSQLAILIC